jgi:uncharacterized membrane protein affecting hemolysin expression
MMNFFYYLGIVLCLAVVVVLALGLGGFAKGGAFNQKYANKLMQLRVVLQFAAVVAVVLFVLVARG